MAEKGRAITKYSILKNFFKNKAILEITNKGYTLSDVVLGINMGTLKKKQFPHLARDAIHLSILTKKGFLDLEVSQSVIERLKAALFVHELIHKNKDWKAINKKFSGKNISLNLNEG